VITADGELQASEKLAQAAAVMAYHPAALQLRLLETVVEVAAEKNSTLILPFPVELLRFLERATPSTSGSDNAVASPREAGVDANSDAKALTSPPIADGPRTLGLDTHIADVSERLPNN
jgi:hypothetical protein